MQKTIHVTHAKETPSNCHVCAAGACLIPGYVRRISTAPLNEGRLIFVRKGKLKIEQENGNNITLKSGDLLIIKNKIKYISSYDCEDYVVDFRNVAEKFSDMPLFSQQIIHLNINSSNQEKLLVLFDGIINELQLMEFGYEFALNVKFMQILLLIYRAYYQENRIADNLNIAKIRPAILEMHNNYSQTMPLKYYADKCNMSLSSFQHTFTKFMNTTPIQYLNKIKLETAMFLLRESDLTVTEISNNLGFSDSAYFSNLFKKKYGLNPTMYREKYR